jgi:hypothetical protein
LLLGGAPAFLRKAQLSFFTPLQPRSLIGKSQRANARRKDALLKGTASAMPKNATPLAVIALPGAMSKERSDHIYCIFFLLLHTFAATAIAFAVELHFSLISVFGCYSFKADREAATTVAEGSEAQRPQARRGTTNRFLVHFLPKNRMSSPKTR